MLVLSSIVVHGLSIPFFVGATTVTSSLICSRRPSFDDLKKAELGGSPDLASPIDYPSRPSPVLAVADLPGRPRVRLCIPRTPSPRTQSV